MFERAHARLQAARNGEKGFTLIELMIVIVILGVLAGIVVFSVQFITNRGNAAACNTNMKNVQSAAEAFYADKGHYPTGIGAAGSTDDETLIGHHVLKDVPTPGTWAVSNTTGVVTVSFPGGAGCANA